MSMCIQLVGSITVDREILSLKLLHWWPTENLSQEIFSDVHIYHRNKYKITKISQICSSIL